MMSRYRVILCGLVLGLFPCLAVSQEACTKAGSQDHQVPNFRVAATCNVDEGKAVIIDTLLAQAESERKTKCPACKCQFAQPSVCTTAILELQFLGAKLQISPIPRSPFKSLISLL